MPGSVVSPVKGACHELLLFVCKETVAGIEVLVGGVTEGGGAILAGDHLIAGYEDLFTKPRVVFAEEGADGDSPEGLARAAVEDQQFTGSAAGSAAYQGQAGAPEVKPTDLLLFGESFFPGDHHHIISGYEGRQLHLGAVGLEIAVIGQGLAPGDEHRTLEVFIPFFRGLEGDHLLRRGFCGNHPEMEHRRIPVLDRQQGGEPGDHLAGAVDVEKWLPDFFGQSEAVLATRGIREAGGCFFSQFQRLLMVPFMVVRDEGFVKHTPVVYLAGQTIEDLRRFGSPLVTVGHFPKGFDISFLFPDKAGESENEV